jgi:hypothetical protein
MYERLELSDCFFFCINSAGKKWFHLFVRYSGNPVCDKGLEGWKQCAHHYAESKLLAPGNGVETLSAVSVCDVGKRSMEGRSCHCQVSVFQWRRTGIRYCSCVLSVGLPDVTSLQWHCGHTQQLWTLLVSPVWNFVIFWQFRMKRVAVIVDIIIIVSQWP